MEPTLNKKPNFIYENFKTSLRDLKKIKTYFWFSFFLFFLIAFLGSLFPIFFEEQILRLIRNLISQTRGLGPLGLIKFIMYNNMQSAFLGMTLGIFLAIFPLGIIIINAYVLGFVINKTVAVEGILILWRLLPHGIFEIPAILISVSLGIMIGISLMKDCIKSHYKNISNLNLTLLVILSIIFLPISFIIYMAITLTKTNLRKKFFNNITLSLRIFILIVIPLLVIAGIIEGFLIFFLS